MNVTSVKFRGTVGEDEGRSSARQAPSSGSAITARVADAKVLGTHRSLLVSGGIARDAEAARSAAPTASTARTARHTQSKQAIPALFREAWRLDRGYPSRDAVAPVWLKNSGPISIG
jgi:hypothetical protein